MAWNTYTRTHAGGTLSCPRGHRPAPEDKTARKFVTSADFMKALHEAGLLPQYPWCSRVVLDAQAGDTVRMYVDQIPSGALLKISPLMEEDHETE